MKIITNKSFTLFLLLAFMIGSGNAYAQSSFILQQMQNNGQNIGSVDNYDEFDNSDEFYSLEDFESSQNTTSNNLSNNGRLQGQVTGSQNDNGNLRVDSIQTLDGTAVADGTFENGLEYAFLITIPLNETNVSMRFSNWSRIGGGGTIPVANNMRISSPQANNSGNTILITSANTYPSTSLNMTGDLDSSRSGKQVKIIVEVAVPSDTPNGNYSTSYGIRTI